ncbi:MAG TPA: hypothetical protein VJA47_00455 [archaeon]|nr:hypothetical protein [archaeon]
MASKNMKLIALLPIVLVLLISGCSSSSGPVTSPGLSVSNFKSDVQSSQLKPLASNEQFVLSLDVSNQGDRPAKSLAVVLQRDAGQFSGGQTLRDSSVSELAVADTHSYTFNMKAPQLPNDIIKSYTIAGRVYYNYETDAVKTIQLVGKDEVKRRMDNNQQIPLSGAVQYTKGPLTVDIGSGIDYIRTSQQKKVYQVPITVTNSGGGVVAYEQSYGTSRDYLVDVKITGASLIPTNSCGQQKTVKLDQGQSRKLLCEFSVDDPNTIDETKTIQVNMQYSYYKDVETMIWIGQKTNE